MKKIVKTFLVFLVFGMLSILIFMFYNYNNVETKLLNELSYTVTEDADYKAGEINSYISEIENDIVILQESEEVKLLFRQNLTHDKNVIKIDVDDRSRVISNEVINYLRLHPNMTLKDLQEDDTFNDIIIQPMGNGFKEIIVQPVGKEGYSFGFDSQTLINYFHKESRRIGFDYHEIRDEFPELWSLFVRNFENGSAEGFYHRDESDGNISYKYGKFVQIPVSTADGINISVGATAYVDDYKIINQSSDYLDSFAEKSNYDNIILFSLDGYLIYMSNIDDDFGTSTEWEVNLDNGLSKNYYKTKETQDISFYGPYIETYGEIYPKFSVITPVYDNNILVGYVGIVEKMNKIFEVAKNYTNLGESGQSYIINRENTLISPLRYDDLDILIQSIDTDNSESCIKDLRILGNEDFVEEHWEDFLTYEDYFGDSVFGTHAYVSKLNWCVISEIDRGELVDSKLNNIIVRYIYLSVVLIFIIFIAAVPLFRIARNVSLRFKKLGVCLVFSILLVLVFVYALSVPRNVSYIGLIPDAVALILFSFLFFYVLFKKGNRFNGIILIGVLSCLFSEIMQISIEGRILGGSLFSILYSIIIFVAVIGISLILFGFREVVK